MSGRRDGEPVLLIQGLGADSRGWIFQQGSLGRRHRVIVFDNRGVGRSDKPPGPYDLEVMTDDALAVLDAAACESAHVVGASMGGVIAQILAVRHPERVRSLVLACTACQNPPWRRELLLEWRAMARAQGMRAFGQANMRWLVGSRSLRRFWPAMGLLAPLVIAAPVHGFVAQIDAILSADEGLREEAGTVDVPALVMVGSQDILTPLADSEELVDLRPHDTELAVIRGAAHGFMIENAGAFNRAVLDFLDRVITDRSHLELDFSQVQSTAAAAG
ncbi:MAG: alpha/beta fold hydrolase [Acidimicrobiales bacterium]